MAHLDPARLRGGTVDFYVRKSKGEGAAPGERDLAVRVGLLRGGARPPQSLILECVDQHKQEFEVEPICTVLSSADVKTAPSTYYASQNRPTSARAVRDVEATGRSRIAGRP